MEVVRKAYPPFPYEQEKEQQAPKKKKAPKKNFRLEKAIYSMALIGMLVLSLTLLLRYATLIQIRHEIHTQNLKIEELQMEKRKAQIQLEAVSKSRSIEFEALNQLEMKYPTHEDTYYISVDSDRVALLTEELNQRMNPSITAETTQNGLFGKILNKVIVLLKI